MSTREVTGAQVATHTPRESTGVDVGVDPSNMDSPSLDVIISSLAPSPPAAAPSGSESLPLEEQEALLSALQDTLRNAEAGGQITKASDAQDSTSSAQVGPDFETVRGILDKLWACGSHLMVQAAELLANGSRNCMYLVSFPYGAKRKETEATGEMSRCWIVWLYPLLTPCSILAAFLRACRDIKLFPSAYRFE